jgi:hypothetical protein
MSSALCGPLRKSVRDIPLKLDEFDYEREGKLTVSQTFERIAILAKVKMFAIGHDVAGWQTCQRDLGMQLPKAEQCAAQACRLNTSGR